MPTHSPKSEVLNTLYKGHLLYDIVFAEKMKKQNNIMAVISKNASKILLRSASIVDEVGHSLLNLFRKSLLQRLRHLAVTRRVAYFSRLLV